MTNMSSRSSIRVFVSCVTVIVPCFDGFLVALLRLLLDDSRMNLLTKLRILGLRADKFYRQISVFELNRMILLMKFKTLDKNPIIFLINFRIAIRDEVFC